MANDVAIIDESQNVSNVISTLTGNDMDTRRRVFRAVTAAEPLSSQVGKVIQVEHIVQQEVISSPETDPVTGEITQDRYIRTILVGPEGQPSYVAASKGIENSVKSIIDILGNPARWDAPEAFLVKEEGKKPRAFLTLELA